MHGRFVVQFLMLNLLNRYILKELALAFLIVLAFLNSILMMEKLLRLSRLLAGIGASAADMLKIIVLIQPTIMLLSVPMALLLATLLVYGRLNHDNELTVMRSAGMSFRRIIRPVTMLGIACFLLTLVISFFLGPFSSARLRETITQIIVERSALAIEEGTFNTSFKDIVIIVKGKKDADTLEGIFIYDNRRRNEPRVLMAKEGKFSIEGGLGIGLRLTDGYVNITRGRSTTEFYFKSSTLSLTVGAESPSPRRNEYTPSELISLSRQEESPKKRIEYLLEAHRRISLPAVCVVLIFLGPPLALRAGKTGRLGGLALGLLVFTLYYAALIYGENLAIAEKLPVLPGAWFAAGLLVGYTFFLFRREEAL